MILGREPVLILALVQATLALAVGFGLKLSGQQVSLLLVSFAAAVLGFVARSQVMPTGTTARRLVTQP